MNEARLPRGVFNDVGPKPSNGAERAAYRLAQHRDAQAYRVAPALAALDERRSQRAFLRCVRFAFNHPKADAPRHIKLKAAEFPHEALWLAVQQRWEMTAAVSETTVRLSR